MGPSALAGRVAALGLLLTLLLATAQPVRAQDTPKPPASETEWQPMQTQMLQPGESFEAKDLVAVAYGFIWVMVAGFVFTVWRRADRLEKEIESLRAQLRAKAGPAR